MKKPAQKKRLHPDTVVLIKQIAVGILLVLLLTGLITGIWYGTRVSSLTISELRISGGETISHDLVESKVREQLTGSYLRLVPRAFALTYPKDDILASLNSIERIKDINLTRSGGTSLNVSFAEFVSDGLWCREGTDCLFVDATGFAFAVAPDLQGGAFVRYVTDREPAVGEMMAETAEYQRVKELINRFSSLGFTTTRVTIDNVRDVYFEILDGGEFRVTLDDEPDQIISNVETVLQSDVFADVTPGNFRYIDLRFGEKVFVNRTFEEENATTTEDALVEFTVAPTNQGTNDASSEADLSATSSTSL